jgi:hypothetical protein
MQSAAYGTEMSRAGGVSMQMIIFAALGILALSVVAYLVVGTGQDTGDSITCATQGGRCTEQGTCSDRITGGDGNLCQTGVCCQPLAIQEQN